MAFNFSHNILLFNQHTHYMQPAARHGRERERDRGSEIRWQMLTMSRD